MARFVSSMEGERLPVAVRGARFRLLRVLGDERTDGRHFVVQQGCS